MTLQWITTPNILYTEQSMNNTTSNIKVVGFDLDHTIIKPIGNTIHPKNKDDFEYVFSNISEKMIELHTSGYSIIIFSNQDNLNKTLIKNR
jgi:DNA 3'-phosphatase